MENIIFSKEKTLIGKEYLINNIDQEKSNIKNLWSSFMKLVPNKFVETYGVSIDCNLETGAFTYILAIEKTTDNQHLIEDSGFKEYKLPESKYCKFTHKGKITPESIANLYDNSFAEIMKNHKQNITTNVFAYELYDRNYKEDTEESEFYLLIPIL